MTHDYRTGQARRDGYAALKDKIWLESEFARSWLVNDTSVMAELLRSPDMALPGLEAMVSHIEKRTGRSLASLRRASQMIPIMHGGEEHGKLRRALAVYLAGKVSGAGEVLPGLVEAALARLRAKPVVDLHHDVMAPLARQFISYLVGTDVPQEILDLKLDLILINRKSPSFVIELDARFAKGLAFLAPIARDEIDTACRLCCLTFGAETVLMMLMEGLLSAIADSQGQPLMLPEFPLETGVPLTWRQATRPRQLGACPIAPGDIVKIKLQAAGYDPDPALRQLIFGAGAHSCVGKQISLVLWEHLARQFNALGLRARIATVEATVEPHMIRYDKAEIEVL